jgi:hypothetical protein
VRSSSSTSSTGLALQGLQQGAADQETLAEDVLLQGLARGGAPGFGKPDLDHLPRVVPFVDRRSDVQPLVALQADQRAAERRGQHLGDFGLADAGFALEEQRTAHAQREEHRRGERALGDIVALR